MKLLKDFKIKIARKIKNILQLDHKNNRIIIINKNGNEKCLRNWNSIKGCTFKITGDYNTIYLYEPIGFNESHPSSIEILGVSNNHISIGQSKDIKFLDIKVLDGDNQQLTIGKNCTFGQTQIFLHTANRKITIGNDCMFSANIYIINADAHKITNRQGEIINQGNNIEIGDHCWIGNHTYILKNAKLGNNCIIGANSVISKAFNENDIIIAGNPARVIKNLDGGTWIR